MAYSQDYSLVMSVQSGDMKAALVLFKKYAALVTKRAALTRCREDFHQEAFEIMVRVAGKVDFGRIKDPENWGFYFMFSMGLLKTALKIVKTETRIRCEDIEADVFTGDRSYRTLDGGSITMTRRTPLSIFNRYLPEHEAFRSSSYEVYRAFIGRCSPTERYLLRLMQGGLRVSDCAKSMRLPYRDVLGMYRALKKAAVQDIRRAAL